MRSVLHLIKIFVIIFLLGVVFTQIWTPNVSPHIEDIIMVVASSRSTSQNKYLSKIEYRSGSIESVAGITDRQIEVEEDLPQVITTDPRILAMRQFLIDYQSPMYPYADVFVTEADKYGLDWRLVASISGVESAFGNLIPFRSNNAWGWKGDPTRAWSHFTSWRQGISTVTERLALGYGVDLTPFDIEATYCPPCGLNPAHAWANGVTNFMNELEQYTQDL